MPATGRLIGTPASISESDEPQTEAIEDEPFDSRMSETTRIVYGNSSIDGQHGDQRALGERAVADVAALGAAHAACLADRERREVVVVQVVLFVSRPSVSRRISSLSVPSATTLSACVWPRVKSAEPCVRGVTPTSMEMSRISFSARPSGRFLCTAMRSRMIDFSSLSKAICAALRFCLAARS